MLLQITNGTVSFGADTVLNDINFEINKGQKVAVVGRNGCGKTTLLKLISGEYPLTKIDGVNSSVVTASNINIGYLRQIAFSDENATMISEIRSAYQELIDIEVKLELLLDKMKTDTDTALLDEYSSLQEHFNLLGGYEYKKEYEVAIRKFGFSESDKNKPLNEFSGGQRTKIAFMKLLLSKPDILLLDEPTNHLDIEAVSWLEDYLRAYKNAFIVVSHDREFLNKTVNYVYEIERGKIKGYTGNYSEYAKKKQLDYLEAVKHYTAQQKEIERLSTLADRFRYKATKAKMAQSKLKQIDRMDLLDKPEEADTKGFYCDFNPEFFSVNLVLKTENLEIGYDTPLSKVSVEIKRGQKVGIVGGNGLGKSTFLKTIVGKIPALSGKFDIGERVKIGYFDQQMAQYKSDKTVLDDFWDEFPSLTQTEIRSTLGAFLFSGDDVFKNVNSLSGGEKVRLELCKIFKRKPNFLILDEPTNHMDIIGKETLEGILSEYEGTVLFVSHDRYFIREIADTILYFSKDSVSVFPYGYEEFEENEKKQKALEESSTAQGTDTKKEKKTYYNPGKEKQKRERRIKKLEELIAECEAKIEETNSLLQSPEIVTDYVKVSELSTELDEYQNKLLEYMEEWDTLSSEE